METAVLALCRLAQYAGIAVMVGTPALLLRSGSAAGVRGWRRMLAAGALATLVGAGGALVVQTAVMAGSWDAAGSPDMLRVVATGTALGVATGVRAIAALAALFILLLVPVGRACWSGVTLSGVIAAGALAWSGHAGATEGPAALPHLAADVLHSLAACLWLGALPALARLAARPGAATDPGTPAAFAAFSSTGTAAVLVLVGTGLVNAAVLVGLDGAPRLLTTPWGWWLIAKLCLFVGMLALAASNRWRLTPALARAQAGMGQGAPPALRRLKTSVAVEAAAGLLLLAAVAVLGLQPPPSHL